MVSISKVKTKHSVQSDVETGLQEIRFELPSYGEGWEKTAVGSVLALTSRYSNDDFVRIPLVSSKGSINEQRPLVLLDGSTTVKTLRDTAEELIRGQLNEEPHSNGVDPGEKVHGFSAFFYEGKVAGEQYLTYVERLRQCAIRGSVCFAFVKESIDTGSITCLAVYDPKQVARNEATNAVRHLTRIAGFFERDLDTAIGDISLLDETDRAILYPPESSFVDEVKGELLHHRIEQNAGRSRNGDSQVGIIRARVEAEQFSFVEREAVLDGATRYAATADGLVPWRERSEHFRKNCIARIPPEEVTP